MNAWPPSPPGSHQSPYQSPYAPPGAWSSHSSYPPAPPAPIAGPNAGTVLYTPNQILLATFLGAPLAGSILMAINEQRLGRPRGVITAVAIGIGFTMVVLGLAFVLPDNFPGLPLSLLGMGALRGVVQMKQAGEIAKHLQWGGRKGSSWAAAGIGVLSAVIVLALAVGAALAYYFVTGKEPD
jgi:hypothetical protein